MRFGTRFIGAVEGVGEESIRTRFRMLIVPLWPIESHFVLEDSLNGFRSFPVPLNRRSITLGYLRWWSFLGIVIGSILWWERGAFFLLSGSLLIWFTSAMILGGCTAETRRKRQILRYATGLSAPPELQPDEMRQDICRTLRDKLSGLEQTLEVESWRELVDEPGGLKAAAFAYATARYASACEDKPADQEQVQESWRLINANWDYWISELS